MSKDEPILDWTKIGTNDELDHDELDDDGCFYFLNGELFNGISISSYPDGQKESFRPCLNGVTHGICRWWHRNGQLSREWTTYRGMGHGWKMAWYEDGGIFRIECVEFGRTLEWHYFSNSGDLIECVTTE